MIYFTSDTHFGHSNICKETSQWTDKSGCRDFRSVEEMNEHIIHSINSVVGQEDTLYHLGDWSFGGIDNIWNLRKRLVCRDIHLVLGNHDQYIRDNRRINNAYFNAGIYEFINKEPKIRYVIDRPDRLKDDNGGAVLAKYLFTSVSNYLELRFGKGKGDFIVMSHYAMRVWNKSHHGSIMLHGHSHGSLPSYDNYRTMDVGYDVRPTPFSLDEIVDIMSSRPYLQIDHHNKSTN